MITTSTSIDKTTFSCEEGKHIGVNNTTGKCIACGKQLEILPMQSIFVKSECMFDNFKISDGPIGLICNCSKCTIS